MEALMSVLGKEISKGKTDEKYPTPPEKLESGEGENASGELMNPAFEAGAQQVMEAVQSGDSAAFADALKACIEMALG